MRFSGFLRPKPASKEAGQGFVGARRPVEDRLTTQQRETLAALRRMGEATKPKRIKLLNEYKEKLKAEGSRPHSDRPAVDRGPVRPTFAIPASLPMTVPKDVQEFVRKLKDESKAVALKLVGNSRSGGRLSIEPATRSTIHEYCR